MNYELPRIVESALQQQQCKFLVPRIRTQYLVSYVSMGLLLKYEILIIPCLGFQFSSAIGLIIRAASKLMSLGLHQFTSLRCLINQIHSFQPPKPSKYSMYKTNLIQDGQLFCQLLEGTSSKERILKTSWIILLNTIPLITTLPQVESFDTMDDSDVICIREDCERFWIDNKSSMQLNLGPCCFVVKVVTIPLTC